jgi:hypothetical protein
MPPLYPEISQYEILSRMPENSAAVQQPDVAHGRERLHIVICATYAIELKVFFRVVSEVDWEPRR